VIEKIGGRSRTRTCDPLIKSQLLYQLSYAPFREGARIPERSPLVDSRARCAPRLAAARRRP
jgi:hypothetical protein